MEAMDPAGPVTNIAELPTVVYFWDPMVGVMPAGQVVEAAAGSASAKVDTVAAAHVAPPVTRTFRRVQPVGLATKPASMSSSMPSWSSLGTSTGSLVSASNRST